MSEVSQSPVYQIEESRPDSEPAGWYYRLHEQEVGPFASREAAAQDLSSRLPDEGRRSSLVGRLLAVVAASRSGVAEKRAPGSWERADPRETDAFGVPARRLSPMAADQYLRLPYNRTVELALGEDPVLLYLASYRFVLQRSGDQLALEDELGRRHLLVEGTTSLGRHPSNDLRIDPAFAEVSRHHLIIDWDGERRLGLTDMSSLGSFVPVHVLQPGAY